MYAHMHTHAHILHTCVPTPVINPEASWDFKDAQCGVESDPLEGQERDFWMPWIPGEPVGMQMGENMGWKLSGNKEQEKGFPECWRLGRKRSWS